MSLVVCYWSLLNHNNLLDILEFLHFSNVCRIVKLNKLACERILHATILWKRILLNLVYEECLAHSQRNEYPNIQHYLATHFQDTEKIRRLIFQNYSSALENFSIDSASWKDTFLEFLPLISSRKSECLYLEKISIRGRVTNRSGHGGHVIRTADGDDLLVLLCGASDYYRMKNNFDLINLTTNSVILSNEQFSLYQPPAYWLFASEVLKKSVLMLSFSPEHEARIFRMDLDSSPQSPKMISRPMIDHDPQKLRHVLGICSGASMLLDPIPLDHAGTIHRLLIFGGSNQTSGQYFNDVFQLVIDEKEPNHVTWTRLDQVRGPRPSPRNCHAMQRVGREMFVFGGWCTLDQAQSNELSDPSNETALVVNNRIFWNDLYSLHLDSLTWRRVQTFGIPPSPRCQSALLRMPPFLPHALRQSPQQQSLLQAYEGTRYLMVVGGANHDSQVRTPRPPSISCYLTHPPSSCRSKGWRRKRSPTEIK
jgi:hypothetical protein